MDSTDRSRPTLVVVGNGMVGHKLLATLVDLDGLDRWQVVTFAEEPRPAYDRVGLSSWFDGATADDLALGTVDQYRTWGVDVRLGEAVEHIDRRSRTVTTGAGAVAYDALVLATGSSPFVPPVAGGDGPGTFVYRTLDDLEAIAAWAARPDVQRGAVIGGGLLGLEAANALRLLGLDTHVVEMAPRLMPLQVDAGGGRALRRHVEELGVGVHLGRATAEVARHDDGRPRHLQFAAEEHADLPIDVLVYSAGIRPRDELARRCGLDVGERGGVVVDERLRTSDDRIWAVGECALVGGRVLGLVAPGYDMARAVAHQLVGEDDPVRATFGGADLSTKLKLLGVDVASFGDAFAAAEGSREVVLDDPVAGTYKKLVVDGATGAVLGGILVGDASSYPVLHQMARGDLPSPQQPAGLLAPTTSGTAAVGVAAMSAAATVCSCENVTKGALCEAVVEGCHDLGSLKATTRAGTGCGGCLPLVKDLLTDELGRAGIEVSTALCEHFDHSRRDLYHLVRFHGYTTFRQLLDNHGRGRGCDVCKPTVASILASIEPGYILDGEQASLQDTNDHFLANLQRDGTYSVVPRIPGGEITPDGLIAIAEVARDFDLYTKITGGQRIDLFGARVDQLPDIWRRLVDAGFESGHAYGKALRTVKSCVGSTWCRYGVQDSVSMAIRVEERYRGLRAPHKIKSAVSGCSRECAEAQSKDFGVIATERGWNLYVAGNGGQRPRHAQLLAEDLDDDLLIRVIDRFLMFYIRTADRLERTATWLEKLEGGLDELRRVVLEDSLGICEELEADMARHVAGYRCEWKETVDDPVRAARFVTFVNAPDQADPTVSFIRTRGQKQPRPRPTGPETPVALTTGSPA